VAKQRIVYIILALFLGGLGIHNFYAGYTGKAISQLLVVLLTGWLLLPLLVVGIWVLVEICTVDRDSEGVLFT
jgi:TM2 domain-containing membrane protein YozV